MRSSPTNHRRRPPCGGPPAAPQSAAQADDAARAACRSISHAHRCPRAPQSERGHRRSPQRSCLNLLPSRATPYLAPAAGTIITATPLARASRQRRWLTLPISADRSVPRVQTPIRGTKKPKHSPQAIIRRRHRCRRLASSVVIVTPASASRGTDRRRRHHRAIVTNKPSTSAAMRRAARCPTERRTSR